MADIFFVGGRNFQTEVGSEVNKFKIFKNKNQGYTIQVEFELTAIEVDKVIGTNEDLIDDQDLATLKKQTPTEELPVNNLFLNDAMTKNANGDYEPNEKNIVKAKLELSATKDMVANGGLEFKIAFATNDGGKTNNGGSKTNNGVIKTNNGGV